MSQQVQVAKQKDKNTRMARRLVWVAVVCNVVGLVLWYPLASSSAGALVLMLLLALVANGAVAVYAISQSLPFEIIIEHKWKKTCHGLGGNFVGQGRAQYHTKVRLNPISSVKDGEWKRKTIYPKLRDVRGTFSSWTGIVFPFYGQNVDDYIKQANRIAFAFHVPHVTFQIAQNGLIAIRAGHVPVPPAYDFEELEA